MRRFRCTNLGVDVGNCGSCGNRCADGSQCVPGIGCACIDPQATVCASPFNEAGTCANLETDPLHCGDCGTVCDRNVLCIDGVCAPFAFTCGNGEVEQGEDCDDGNDVDDATCPAGCVLPVCGPGQSSCFDFNPYSVGRLRR